MKALPQRFSERWVQAKADPEGVVRFLIRPLDNRIRSHIQSQTVTWVATGECNECKQPLYRKEVDGAAAAYDTVGFGLIAVEGLVEAEDKPFALNKTQEKLGKKSIPRVTDDCLDRLPALLFEEIQAEINASTTMTEEEIESLKNTLDSSSQDSTPASSATETSPTASTDVATED